MDVICVLSLLSPPSRLSFVSVVFDFNASLNDVAPVSLISLTVDLLRMDCRWMSFVSFVCCFFCIHF